MREIISINNGWSFSINNTNKIVDLPHTWNNLDGQNGENGYLRGRGVYQRSIPECDGVTYLEFNGANSKADVFIDGIPVASHKGGYSSFRVNISAWMSTDRNIRVEVDNSDDAEIYPSTADFTFWGGLYRDVNLIKTGMCHFSMSDFSSDGVYVTPFKKNGKWYIGIKSLIENAEEGITVRYTLTDMSGNTVRTAEREASAPNALIEYAEPELWQGTENPYLYNLKCEITDDGEVSDSLDIPVGFREYCFDAENGFFLNGKHFKLKGVSRHQDRENMGNAITAKEHEEDIRLILETGANSVRLAHYQQNRYFYSLCDKYGLLAWAEVPVISRYSPRKQENARQQLCELIKQNYNHPSIYTWGIENEISIGLTSDKKLAAALTELRDLAKKLDATRPVTCAQLSMLSNTSELNNITDILGYNHYFGWYADTVDGIDRWLDKFHTDMPYVKLCLSEYGAEGITTLHSENPVQGDYSEDYQCLFHEHYIKAINSRDWLWGSYVWNMFDFGSAMRNEGGVRGRNNKGLITYDRKLRKDSFYLYKAFWSDEEFIHITKARFVNRVTGKTEIKVYSNLPEITLHHNGKTTKLKADKIFVFANIDVLPGENVFKATGGKLSDSITVNGVENADPDYNLPDSAGSFVHNWFEDSRADDGSRLSANDRLGDVLTSSEVKSMLSTVVSEKKIKLITGPLLKPLHPVRIKTLLKAAKAAGVNENLLNMADGYLHTMKKGN